MTNPPVGLPASASTQLRLTHVDRPEVSETFADSLGRMTFEGFHAKLEFVVNRMDEPKPPAPPTGKAVTACRLVLPVSGIVDLHGKLTMLINQLQATSALKPIAAPPTAGKPN